MTLAEAIEAVKAYDAHQWIYEVASDGSVVVGGTDHTLSVYKARQAGHEGQVYHVYE